jgi:hypothetical protein
MHESMPREGSKPDGRAGGFQRRRAVLQLSQPEVRLHASSATLPLDLSIGPSCSKKLFTREYVSTKVRIAPSAPSVIGHSRALRPKRDD